jgi:type II secretory pathway pseudopilin PulG
MSSERGLTLIELLVGATLMLVVLAATLSTMDRFTGTTRRTELQNDSQELARQGMTQLARELRNHAVANTAAPEGIALAHKYDLVFETVGRDRPAGTSNTANVERIRYCLDTDRPSSSTLYAQVQRWTTATPPPVPSTLSCPAPDWGNRRVVAQNVVNMHGGLDRAVFTYDSAVPSAVRRVSMTLYVDTTPGQLPKETRLQSGIFLRNANHAPSASFAATVTGGGTVVLNATGSTDPEGERLSYAWKADGVALPGSSATLDYTPASGGSHTVELRVTDPGGLYGTQTQTVVVP